MGTQKPLPTPSGGGWTAVKREITRVLQRDAPVRPNTIIRGVMEATGGLGGAAHGGRAGGGGGGSGSGTVGRAVSGLAGFAAAVRDGGLAGAAAVLGLADLRDRPAAEVIARIAERLAEAADGPQHDLLAGALRDAILECAALEGGGSYESLDDALQSYLESQGVDGLIESFLSHFVFDRIWAYLEQHADDRGDGATEAAMASAVEAACRRHVQDLVQTVREEGRFERADWFGREGIRLGEGIIATLESRLRTVSDGAPL